MIKEINWKRFIKQQITFFVIYNLIFHTGDVEAASLVLGVAGSFVGGLIGGPLGAQLGYALGSMAGSTLFSPTQKIDNGRLDNPGVQSNAIGVAIGKVWGTKSKGGNIIWTNGYTDHPSVEKQGKGGPSVETTNHAYTIDLTIGVCEGPITNFRRIWANEKLIWDLSEGGAIGDYKNCIRIYKGTNDEPIDSLMQLTNGIYTPAYNKLAKVVFENFPVTAEFGNQVPVFKFEVVNSPNVDTTDSITFYTYSANDTYRQLFINQLNNDIISIGSSATQNITLIEIIDPITMQVKKTATIPYLALEGRNSSDNNSKTLITKEGIIVSHQRSNTNNAKFIIIDGTSLNYTITDVSSYSGSTDPFAKFKSAGYNVNNAIDLRLMECNSGKSFLCLTPQSATELVHCNITLIDGAGATINKYNIANSYYNGLNMYCSDGLDTIYFPTYGKDGLSCDYKNVYLSKINSSGITENFVQLHHHLTLDFVVRSMIYDKVNKKIFAVLARYGSGGSGSYPLKIIKIDAQTLTVDDQFIPDIPNYSTSPLINADFYNRKLIGYALTNEAYSGNGYFLTIGMDDFSMEKTYFTVTDDLGNNSISALPNNSIYNKSKDAYVYVAGNSISAPKALILNNGKKLGFGTYPLSEVVTEIVIETGLGRDKVDASDLAGIEVRGFDRNSRMQARSLLETLALLYNFDGIDSNDKLYFYKRGKAPVATITEEEIGARFYSTDSFSSVFKTQKIPDLELPRKSNILYYDIDKDYAQNTQEAKRVIETTENVLTVTAPAVFNADEAKQIIDRIMYQTWGSRNKYQFETNYDYINVQPSDVIILRKNNTDYHIRITKKDESQGIIKWEGVSEESVVYTQNGIGGIGEVSNQTVSITSDTDLYLIDAPIIDISDDNVGMYAVVGKTSPDAKWRSAVAYKADSQDGSFVSQSSFSSSTIIGHTVGVLQPGQTDSDGELLNYLDFLSSVVVNINEGELQSISEEVMNNTTQNFALIGKEYVQYMNAELKGNNQYKLSGFLRGRFMTNQYHSTHQANDTCIFLNFNDGSIKRVNKDDTMIGVERYWKGVTSGKLLSDSNSFSYTNNAIGLKPYAVVNVLAGRSNDDLILSWDSRIRGRVILGNTLDPIDPDGSSYEIDIISGSSVVRTINTNSLQITYTQAQQIADFGSIQSSIKVKIYKISPIIGRGFEFVGTF